MSSALDQDRSGFTRAYASSRDVMEGREVEEEQPAQSPRELSCLCAVAASVQRGADTGTPAGVKTTRSPKAQDVHSLGKVPQLPQ